MDFISAVKSGRPFKRIDWDEYLEPNCRMYQIPLDGILATDWEIKEITVPVSRSQFYTAYSAALKEVGVCRRMCHLDTIALEKVITILGKKLGIIASE